MIKTISLKGVTSYPNDQAVVLGPLKRVNLVYGLNGSGKSTVGDYLQDLTGNRYLTCQVDPAIKQDQVFVYNQKFIEKNFHQESHPGIFTLNEGNIEAKEKIAELQQSLETANKEIDRIRTKLSGGDEAHGRAITAYKDALWDIRLEFEKGDLAACFRGQRHKEAFKDQLEKTALPTSPVRTKKELSEAAKSLSSSDAIPIVALPELSFAGATLENDPILTKVITPSGDSYLADLIQKLGNSDWVKKALPYLDHSENACPLCQQDLPHEFQRNVKSLFDETYNQEVSKVVLLREKYVKAADLLELELESPAYTSSAIQSEAAFIKAKAEIKRLMAVNRNKLAEKEESVSKSLSLESTANALANLNSAIKAQKAKDDEYNLRLSKKEQLLSQVVAEVWQVMRQRAEKTIVTHKEVTKTYLKSISELNAKKKELSDQVIRDLASITEYQSKMTNVDEAVKKIDAAIANIGITGFNLKKVDGDETSYRLVRGSNSNDVYRSLSEGEKTLITFLYFLELCAGSVDADKPVVASDRVIVIDDPISSLSHNYVYEVAAHIYHRVLCATLKFKQIIVLTHNLFFFHELLKNAPKGVTKHYACFRVSKGAHSAITQLGQEEIKNDYESYWQVIREARDSKVHAAVLPNMMRNILEHYFGFIHKNDDLLKALEALERDDHEFKPLYRYINRQSHGGAINVTDFGGWSADKMIEKFQGVFARSGYPEHYAVMMGGIAGEEEGTIPASA
ncbi:Wobble nucleotide-excising tRNase [Pseudomonas asplenii]|uniref:Wobble nucleotide-excising tRNase n=1 Tax=Pseudomonas asplenii TaxID=53407 RepID=A0A1H6NDW3_9PSED|nr:AAA family ATPase [Pseudomonas fuscovaginae]SEI13308.1 Wobble nucleotide-excising tRNase [Pseudomonas fuscovaginae]